MMDIVEYFHESHYLFEVVSNKTLLFCNDVKCLFII